MGKLESFSQGRGISGSVSVSASASGDGVPSLCVEGRFRPELLPLLTSRLLVRERYAAGAICTRRPTRRPADTATDTGTDTLPSSQQFNFQTKSRFMDLMDATGDETYLLLVALLRLKKKSR